MKKGKLYGVSVGPGDPELMTLKAARILREADVIALPSGSKERCEAYKIAVQAVPEIDNKEFLMPAYAGVFFRVSRARNRTRRCAGAFVRDNGTLCFWLYP